MTINTQTPLNQWLSRNIQLYGPGGMGGGSQWAGDYDPTMGIGYSPTVGWNAFEAAGSPGGSWDDWLGIQYLKSRNLTPEAFAASQPNIKYDPATKTVTDVSNDDQQSGLNGFWTGPGTIAGLMFGGAAAGGAGAAGSGAGATGAFDMGIGGVGESMGLGGGYTGATGLGGSAMDLGGFSMPPAQLDPSVADFINAGTTPSGGSIFTADGLNPSVLGLGGESAGMWDTIRNLPTNALKALGLTKPDGSADGGALMSLLGKLGAAGLGAYGSSQQSNALTELANKYSEYGAPSRARFEASMTPGFDPSTIPGYSGALDAASKSVMARLSATGGNPFGNPAGLVQANKDIVSGTAMPALGEYQRLNLSAGGLGNLNAAVPALQQGAINADGNVLSALGYGLNAATQQQPQQQSLADLMKAFNIQGLS